MNHALMIELPRAFSRRAEALLTDLDFDCVDARSVHEAGDLLQAMPITVVLTRAKDGPGGVVRLLSLLPLSPDHRVVVFAEEPDSSALLGEVESDRIKCFPVDLSSSALRSFLRQARRRPAEGKPAERFGQMLGDCTAMREVYTLIAKVAPTDAAVLICGESGTGKELVASAIHRRSERGDAPFVAINCGAIAENLIESELFGHEKGAFTGAQKPRAGVFEQAHGGTLFLDEITEMPIEMQVRLLRVLENATVRRVGGDKDVHVDVRVVAATNRDPQAAVDEGRFREDLMFRLAVFPISLPPLRDRDDDVLLIARHYLSEHNHDNATAKRLSPTAEQRLKEYDWPGNVRQLRNMIHRAFIIEGDDIDLDCLVDLIEQDEPDSCDAAVNGKDESDGASKDRSGHSNGGSRTATTTVAVPAPASTDPGGGSGSGSVEVPVGTTIDEAEKQLILKTMEELDGDKPEVARVLGISLKTLYNRLKSYEQ
jgi:DNA-binding NtrC family response regulator